MKRIATNIMSKEVGALGRLLNLLEEVSIVWDELVMRYARDIVDIVLFTGVFFGYLLVGVTYFYLSNLSVAEAVLLCIAVYAGYNLLGFYLAFRVAVYRAVNHS